MLNGPDDKQRRQRTMSIDSFFCCCLSSVDQNDVWNNKTTLSVVSPNSERIFSLFKSFFFLFWWLRCPNEWEDIFQLTTQTEFPPVFGESTFIEFLGFRTFFGYFSFKIAIIRYNEEAKKKPEKREKEEEKTVHEIS